MRNVLCLALLALAACRGSGPPADAQASQASPPPESEPPVALNPDSPIAYPPALFEQRIEGDVTLRLFVDSTGRLVPESSRVADPSGYPALDSAALSGSRGLKFAPAKRHGVAVATAFLQPVEFRQVGTTRTGTVTLPPPAAPPPAPAPARVVPRPRPPAAPPPPPQPRPDTTRADTTRQRPDTSPPAPPPLPLPAPPAPTPVPPPSPSAGGAAH